MLTPVECGLSFWCILRIRGLTVKVTVFFTMLLHEMETQNDATTLPYSQEACGMISLSRVFGMMETSVLYRYLAQASKNKESLWSNEVCQKLCRVNQRSTHGSNFKHTQMAVGESLNIMRHRLVLLLSMTLLSSHILQLITVNTGLEIISFVIPNHEDKQVNG